MKVKEALEGILSSLNGVGIEEPRIDAELLLAFVLGKERLDLYLDPYLSLKGDDASLLFSLIRERISHRPLQYILGRAHFMAYEFIVREGVFIPRPETERLVEVALERMEGRRNPTIVDIGTGCGNIAISMAKSIPSRVYATEISSQSLRIAKENAELIGAPEIIFLPARRTSSLAGGKGDLLEPLREKSLEGKVDLILSNPPYIPTYEIDHLPKEVSQWEPTLALDGGEDGLSFHRAIVEESFPFLKEDGYLILEVGNGQAMDVVELIRGRQWATELIKDYSGIERVVIANLPAKVGGPAH